MRITILAVMTTLWLTGCGSTSPRSGSTEESTMSDAPEWFLKMPASADILYGVGNAKKQNPALARKTATARARDEVSQAVEVKVSNLMKDFMEESGIGDNAQALELSKSVSKQVAAVTLQGSTVRESHIGKDGTMYILVEYSLSAARHAALEEAKNREAEFNKLEAQKGFDELEEALRNMD